MYLKLKACKIEQPVQIVHTDLHNLSQVWQVVHAFISVPV